MHRRFTTVFHLSLLAVILAGLLFPPQSSVHAAPVITVTPVTWNVIGLDSNDPLNSGPENFPIGARVCNTSPTDAATGVKATFDWGDPDTYDLFSNDANPHPYINLRPATNSEVNIGTLAANTCADAYFEVKVNRSPLAYEKTRRYHIDVTSTSPGGTVTTSTPRELFVEHLISQSRNYVYDVKLGPGYSGTGTSVPPGGTMTLMVGQTYDITINGKTATQGYNQLEEFINFPNTIFQVLDVSTTYSADSSPAVPAPFQNTTMLYGDACKWDSDPGSPTYRSCIGGDYKNGGSVDITYTVKILAVPSNPPALVNPQPLSTLVYDFSGSSYHYNADFGISTRYAYIVGPSSITIDKTFAPKTIAPNSTSVMTIKLTNPVPEKFTGVNFADVFPSSNLKVADIPGVTYTGCGGGALSSTTPAVTALAGGESSIYFLGGTLSPNSNCTITLNVTATTAGTYVNTTGNLYINTSVDTGNTGRDTLNASALPAAPSSCVGNEATLATWAFPPAGQGSAGGSTTPDWTTKPGATSASASRSAGTFNILTTALGGNTPNAWAANWPITVSGTATPPASTSTPYFDFAVDYNLNQYNGVQISFSIYLGGAGDWGANANNYVYVYSKADNGSFNTGAAFQTDKAGWFTYTNMAPASGLTRTTFRITALGSSKATARVVLDNVILRGCLNTNPSPPTISKVFDPPSIKQNDTSSLIFTIANPNVNSALSGVAFTDVLPAGLSVVDALSVPATCDPAAGSSLTLTTTAATRTLSVTGGTLAAGASCTISVPIGGIAAGQYQNVSANITSTQSGTNTGSTGYATAPLSVVAPPGITKQFGATTIFTGASTSLTFTVTNPNPAVTLSGISFTDNLPSGLVVSDPNGLSGTCGGGSITAAPSSATITLGTPTTATLAANSSCTFSVNVTGTSVLPSSTKINTTTNVTSTEGGNGNAATASLVVNDLSPSIELTKQISASGTSGPWYGFVSVTTGSNVWYRFAAYNSGDVPFTAISVSDPTLSALVPSLDSSACTWKDSAGSAFTFPLLPGDSAYCVLGPMPAVAGSHTNTASITGTHAGGTTTPVSDQATYGTPAITLAKSVTQTSFTSAADVLNYSYLVTNSGFVPLPGPVTVADDKAAVTCPAVDTVGDRDNYFDPGESLTCTASYIVTVDDVNAGFITNTALATVSGASSNTSSKTVYKIPDFTVSKTNNVSGSIAQNGTFNWTLTVSNSSSGAGTFSDTQTVLSDTLPGAISYYLQGPLTVTPGPAAPDGTVNCSIAGTALTCAASGAVTFPKESSFSITFPVTPFLAGSLLNTATVDPNGNITESDEANNSSTDVVTIAAVFDAQPSKSLVTTSEPSTEFISGTERVTIGEMVRYRLISRIPVGSFTNVQLLDGIPDGLQFLNDGTATVAFVCNGGAACMASSTLSGPGLVINGASGNASPTFAVPASAISGGPFNVGTDVIFSVGNITNLDADLDSEYVVIEFNALVLNVNSSITINQGTNNQTGANVINNRQNDVTLFVNGSMIGSASPNVTVGIAEPAITSFVKSVLPASGPYLPGDSVTYTLSFENTTLGNTNAATAFDITLSDTFDTNLSLGAVSVTATQGASCAGGTAFVTGHSTLGQLVTVTVSCLDPGKTVTVTVNATIAGAPPSGTTIANSSSLTYTSLPGMYGNCSTAPFTCAGVGISGSRTGERNGSGGSGTDGTVLNNYASTSNTVNATVGYGSITITKNAVPDHSQDFDFTGSGPGGYDFGGTFHLDDDADGLLPNTQTFAPLAPGSYSVTEGLVGGWSLTDLTCVDPDTGSSTDVGTGTATIDLDAGESISCTYVNTQLTASMVLTKAATLNDAVTAPAGIVNPGDTITYSFFIRNTGSVTLTSIAVTDPLLPPLSCTLESLAPGASANCTAANNIYTLTEADINAGSRLNTATATGKDPGINDVTDSDTLTVSLTQVPAINIAKTPAMQTVSSGGTAMFTLTVTNTGNVTFTGVDVTDSQCSTGPAFMGGDSNNDNQLQTTEAWIYSCSKTNVTAGFTNTANVTTTQGASDSDSANVTVAAVPALTIAKNATETTYANAGDILHYSYVVTNSGNVTLDGPFTVIDDRSVDESCPATLTLASNASITCTATYTVTQADLDAGSVTNIASAHGIFDGSVVNSPTDTETVDAVQGPELTIVKSSDATGANAVGDIITYVYDVENTGNVTLSNVTVSDGHTGLSTIGCTPGQGSSLLPGATMRCTATYTVIQADVDAGNIDNTGVVMGVSPAGGNITDNDQLTEPVAQVPALNIVKEVSATANGPWNDTSIMVTVGDTVYYRLRVANTGNVTLTGLIVNDGMTGCTLIRDPDIVGNNDGVFEVDEEWVYICSVTAVFGTNNNTATADSQETIQDSDSVSYNAGAILVADPAISKAGNPTQASVGESVTFTLVITNQGTAPAPDVVVTDVLPSMFDVTSVNVTGAPLGTTVDVSPSIGTSSAPYTVVVSLGDDLGVTDVVTIRIATTVNGLGTSPINNTASLTTSALTDVISNNSDSVTIYIRSSGVVSRPVLPATGFRMGGTTMLGSQPSTWKYATTDIMLEIPSLGVKIPIVGVPKKNGTWNVAWLGNQAGWLEGSAFPSWNGNSVLTSHLYLANGKPGPFVNLSRMKFGEKIIVHAYGQIYTFEVQTNTTVLPNDASVMKHEEKPWLTLVTCKNYDEKSGTYLNRVVVRAVLVSVDWE